MKTSTRSSRWFKNTIPVVILLALSLALSASAGAAISVVSDSGAPPNQPGSPGQFSGGLSEVLKMVDAKVDVNVITAYIQSSPTAYNPSASEIIALNDRGVPSEVIAAMLKRGSELRAMAMASTPPPQPIPNATAPYTENPDYSSAPPATYSDYGYPSSSVYYDSSYGYPYYGYSYPWYGYWPSFSFGYYPYYHRYPYNSFGRFGHRDHFTAFRGTTRFNGGFNRFPSHSGGFRTMASPRASVTIGSHSSGFRGGSFGGGFRGGSFRGGGGFTAHAGGGGHASGRGR